MLASLKGKTHCDSDFYTNPCPFLQSSQSSFPTLSDWSPSPVVEFESDTFVRCSQKHKMLLSFVLLSAMIHQRDALSVFSDIDAMKYLSNFGYLDPKLGDTSTSFVSGETVRRAISDFQSFAGLYPTGELDEETSIWMSKPRCGVPDIIHEGYSTRRKRNINKKGDRWKKQHLTYHILKYTKQLKKSDVDREIARAFQMWEEVTEFKFTPKMTGRADIEIRFESGIHDDNDTPFDGPGGTFAHATFPEFGDVHFDDDETWTINDTSGTDLFQVATHEFGHVLGLKHSKVKPAVMKPYSEGTEPNFKLHDDDIERIQKLYEFNMDTKWITEKFDEITSTFKTMEKELKETKRDLALATGTIENLKTALNARTRDIRDMGGKMPTSCKDLESMGQKISGIFLVKGLKNIDAIFCDFNPNTNNENLEKWIGHADIKSQSVNFYVQRNGPFNETGVSIPFNVERVNVGKAMELTSGIFTAPRTGIYFFSFSGMASFPKTTSSDRARLVISVCLGDNSIARVQAEESNSVANQVSSLSLQLTLNLVKDEDIWLRIDVMSSGVLLYDDPAPERGGHWTHFTGWMLEEEIAKRHVEF
uniref:C1q domain-containing protein n=1 Tax=Daphnia galeata TaxID=27404 RepID=A0A8J2WHS7_9CRUS|nr:unnamed protein product [Daphnia galeata]